MDLGSSLPYYLPDNMGGAEGGYFFKEGTAMRQVRRSFLKSSIEKRPDFFQIFFLRCVARIEWPSPIRCSRPATFQQHFSPLQSPASHPHPSSLDRSAGRSPACGLGRRRGSLQVCNQMCPGNRGWRWREMKPFFPCIKRSLPQTSVSDLQAQR